VAFSSGQVMRIAEDSPSGAPTACSLALATSAPGRVQAAGRRPAACAPGCPSPEVSRPLRARLRRACPVAPPGLCERLGCAPCATTTDLGACLATAAAGIVTEVVHADAPQSDDRCFRAARRAAVRAASRRLRAIARCARSRGASCVATAPAPRVTGLTRPCRTPPAAVCTAFACLSCTTAADLASCVGQATVAPVDALARALLGS
jgi:hypothetical protein